MSEVVGSQLTRALVDLLDKRLTTAVLATLDREGRPHTTPVSFIACKDAATVRLALTRNHQAYSNIRRSPEVMIELLDEGDVAFGVLGRAVVEKETMESDRSMALVRVEVMSVKSDVSPLWVVSQGVRCAKRQSTVIPYSQSVFRELME